MKGPAPRLGMNKSNRILPEIICHDSECLPEGAGWGLHRFRGVGNRSALPENPLLGGSHNR